MLLNHAIISEMKSRYILYMKHTQEIHFGWTNKDFLLTVEGFPDKYYYQFAVNIFKYWQYFMIMG